MNDIKLKGSHWFVEGERLVEYEITTGFIRDGERTIVFSYKYDNENEHVELTSEDGILFKGNVKSLGEEIYKCGFTLYKNREGYFLFGEASNSEKGLKDDWCVALKPESGLKE